MSTDKLEKPKHNNSQQPTSQMSSNPPSAPCTGSLPRRNASGVFYRTPQDFVGGSQSNLRRNCSMNDLQQKNQDNQSSWLPAPPPQVQNRIYDHNFHNDHNDHIDHCGQTTVTTVSTMATLTTITKCAKQDDNNDLDSVFRLKRVSKFPPVWFEALSSLFFKARFSSLKIPQSSSTRSASAVFCS